MSYRVEKETGDLVIDGFEQGMQASPHAGIANIQNANIATEIGEVVSSYARTQQTIQSTATGTGTLSYLSTDHVNLDISGSNDFFKGQWITVTNSSHTGELPNGTYYVPPSTGAGFQLAPYYNVSATAGGAQNAQVLVVGGGAGGGSYAGSGANSGGGGGGAGAVNYNAALSIANNSVFTVTVGAGGAGGDSTSSYQGYPGSTSSFSSITSTGGGGGGGSVTGTQTGANGGSGGGAGTNGSATTISGGTGSTGGNNGGNSVGANTAAAGGGGAGAVGQSIAAAGAIGGNGGTGTAYSISGASVTYGGGGGGGAATGGTGGTGGGGAGSSGSGNGAAATANTGGGGGGAFRGASGSGYVGGVGGSGIVIISYPTGVVTNTSTAGGIHTVSGGRDIFTFATVGSFTFSPTYANTAAPTSPLTGFTAGLTATIQLVNTMGKPISKASENYLRSGVAYNRYYILDNKNVVWVYDTYNETLYSSSDNVGWFIPDYKTDWCTRADSIAVLNGMLVASAKSGVYAKPTVQLGGTNTQNTTWAEFTNDIPWNGNPTANHFSYVGHQGYLYTTDGNYIRSFFPDSTLSQTVAGSTVTTTGDNVQSMGSWTIDTGRTQLGFYTYGTPSPVDGSMPWTSDAAALPVIFFTDGTLPNSITANRVYYITRDSNDFVITADPSLNIGSNSVTMTGMPSAGAQTATLTGSWNHPTGYYLATFFYSGGTETYNVFLTNGLTSVIWNTPLVHNTNSTTLSILGSLDVSTGAVGNQYYATFFPTSSGSNPTGNTPLYVSTPQRLTLPNFEIAQTMTEISNYIMVGCAGNVLYPWDQVSNLPGNIIALPEGNVQTLLTVNQMAYIFAGNKGNIYITDGSTASLVLKVPDYVAGVPGTPSSYIEPYFIWGDAMYLRGRVHFSVLDQTATKAGNCGGIWSFIPTQNLYIGQDVGISLRLQNKSSYATYNGYSTVLIQKQNQAANAPQYWNAWDSDITSPTYGIDATSTGTASTSPFVVETDLIPTGTLLDKKTFEQVEFKVSTPLLATDSIAIYYRKDATSAWVSLGTARLEPSNRLAGYLAATFEKTQWLQLRAIGTSGTASSFIRMTEIRVR